MGGALDVDSSQLSPMGRSGARFILNALGLVLDPAAVLTVQAYLRQVSVSMAPHTTGTVFANFLVGEQASRDRIRWAYSPGEWARLVELKQRYDRENLFRFNRNIPPGD